MHPAEVGLVHDDLETTRSRSPVRPTVRPPRAAGNDNRFRRELGDARLDRLSIGTAPASHYRNSHVSAAMSSALAPARHAHAAIHPTSFLR
jgi:hypothetical protein